jgi:ribosomal-protein-serine acetyltransferase
MMLEGQMIGVVSLENIYAMHRCAHVGYWLDEGVQGRGLMHAAVSRLFDYAFDERKLHVVEIRAATENRRSRSVAEKLGLLYEGELRHREWLYDHFVDLSVYSILAHEWRARAA